MPNQNATFNSPVVSRHLSNKLTKSDVAQMTNWARPTEMKFQKEIKEALQEYNKLVTV
jgi:hypothetical protein